MIEPEPPSVHNGLHLHIPVDKGDGQESQDNSSSSLVGNSSFDDSGAVVSRRPSSTSTTRPSLRPISNEARLSHIADTSNLRVDKPSCEAEGEGRTTGLAIEPRELRRPNPLSFLEMDSPPVTQERILQAIAKTSRNCPPHKIASLGRIGSSQLSTAEGCITAPDPSIRGDCPPTTAV
jgi:hypothetical protein